MQGINQCDPQHACNHDPGKPDSKFIVDMDHIRLKPADHLETGG